MAAKLKKNDSGGGGFLYVWKAHKPTFLVWWRVPPPPCPSPTSGAYACKRKQCIHHISSLSELLVFCHLLFLPHISFLFYSMRLISLSLSLSFVLFSVYSSYSISEREEVNVQSTFISSISCILCILEIQF